MGWSDEEEPVFVLEDGTVLIYTLFGIFKTSFSMGQEAKDMKILNARYVIASIICHFILKPFITFSERSKSKLLLFNTRDTGGRTSDV